MVQPAAASASTQERPIPEEPPTTSDERWYGPQSDAWRSSLDETAYREGVETIRSRIAAGDVYQANLCRVLTAVDAALKRASLNAHEQWGEGEEIRTRKRRISPRTANQAAYLRALRANELVFGLGPDILRVIVKNGRLPGSRGRIIRRR